LLRLDRGDAAFEYVERSRARAFLDLLASGNLDIAAGWQKGAARKQNYEPELALLATVQPLSLSGVQILLDDDSELLEYYITDDRLLIWLISKNSVEVFTVEVSAGQLEEMTLGFRTTIELRGDIRPLSRDLYRLLVTPVEQAITSDKLIIVPHSILNYLPFQALQNETGDYLIDRYSITYLPSASVMNFLPSKRRQFKGKLLALGNPATDREGFKSLPFAEGEVTGIGNIFPGSVVRIGADATEEEFRRLAGQYDLLHLACHSELNAAYPMFSGLLLSPGGDQDGELDVHEVFTLDLNAYLVVLSGCETGLGKLTSGDDLVGLSRAFIYAGTPALAASLWQVADESTGYLMTEFYRNLRELGRAEALRQAQLATREKYPHPFHWAPFVLIGEGQ